MTTPFQPAPDEAYQIGGSEFGFGQGLSDAGAAQLMLGGFTSIANPFQMLSTMASALSKLPLEVLNLFAPMVPGIEIFDTVSQAVQMITDQFANLAPLLTSTFNDFISNTYNLLSREVEQIFEIVSGIFVTPISSAVQSFKDWWTMLSGKTSGLGSNGSVPANILTGTINEAVTGINKLRDSVFNGFGLFSGITGSTNQDLQKQAASIAQTNQSVLASLTALQTASATNQSNVPVGGLNKVIAAFVGADGATPDPADIRITGPSSGDVVIRNNFLGIKATNPLGVFFAGVNALYKTEDQALEFVLGDNGLWNGAATYGLFHCDLSCTIGYYVKAVSDSLTLGSFSRSGGTWTFTPFSGGQIAYPLRGGNRVRIRNTDTSFTPEVNGNPLPSFVSSAVAFSPDRRSAFIALERAFSGGFFGLGAQNYDSFSVGGIVVSDFVSAPIVGSGAELVRTATANFTLTKGANPVVFPDGFWQDSRNVSSDFVVNVSKGRIYSAKSRFITINARVESTTGFTFFYLRLYRGQGGGEPSVDKKIGMQATPGDQGAFYAYEGTASTYIKAGEYISLGYLNNSGAFGNTNINATADGFSVYMTIVGAG